MPGGKLATSCVAVTDEGWADADAPKPTRSLAGLVAKLFPEIVTAVAAAPMLGLNPEMVGAPADAVTVNEVVLVAEPLGAVTEIGPVVAPVGMLVTIRFVVDEATAAAAPLNVTAF